MSSFEMVSSYILPTFQIVLKWKQNWPLKNSNYFIVKRSDWKMLRRKCIALVELEYSGQGQPTWGTTLLSKWVFYSMK